MNWLTLLVAGLAVALVVALILVGRTLRITGKPYWRRPLIIAALVVVGTVAGMLPLRSLDPNQLTTDSDIIFIVDTTYSMNALDGRDGDTRLTDVKNDLRAFAQSMQGSRFGIMTYELATAIYLPLTTTYSDLDTAADTLEGGAFLFATNDPSLTGALTYTKEYLQKVQAADVTRHQVVVLMTDGELTGKTDSADSVNNAAAELATVADAFVVIGYGTNNGGRMPEIRIDFDDGTLYREPNRYAQVFTNNRYTEVISKRDENQLRAIAGRTNGTYVPAQEVAQATSAIVNARQQAASRQAASPESQALRQNLLHIPIALSIIIWLFITEVWGVAKVREFIGSWRRQ